MNFSLETSLNFLREYLNDLLLVVILLFFGQFFLKWVVVKAVRARYRTKEASQTIRARRAKTFASLLIATGRILIYIVLLIVVLGFFGVDAKPILAGAGILGVALGFGAQSLIKDFLSGLFIFFEHQYSIGDRVKIGDFEGIVYRVTMRSTVLKDDEGNRYYIANGTINNVRNFSQGK